jgi:hypothetical protein
MAVDALGIQIYSSCIPEGQVLSEISLIGKMSLETY